MRFKTITKLILGLFLIFNVESAYAAIYYISPTVNGGSDSGDGSQGKPWATFAYAFSKMTSGDTLYIMDGTYNQQLNNMPSGTDPSNPTRILAQNPHKVTIDGQGSINPIRISGKSYVELDGIRVKNANTGTSYLNDVMVIENCSYITVRRSGFWQAGTYMHNLPVKISGSSYCLFEDVWVFGRGRYCLMDFQGHYNTFRRVVARWDSGTYVGQPNAGISIYNSHHELIENCIVIDSNEQKVQPSHSGIAIYAHLTAPTNITFRGNIILNNRRSSPTATKIVGMVVDPGPEAGMYANDIDIKDCVIWSNDSGLSLSGLGNEVGHPIRLDHSTIGKSGVGDGLYQGSNYRGTILTNSLITDNFQYGVNNNSGADQMAINYINNSMNAVGEYKNATCSSGCLSSSPFEEGSLKYLPRIEAESSLSMADMNGSNIGANIEKRYVNGVLTAESLWPWPYEDWIQEDMREISTRGFCADGQTLTKYIWVYLGNPLIRNVIMQ
ncbi:MAG: right-handed parallel beta-helix repeat-containing protein [Desulfobulbaceae bacterium]|nr:right-handed parallel beta-helix repeat-containing protein [Desulfobulbaceae bacterium]